MMRSGSVSLVPQIVFATLLVQAFCGSSSAFCPSLSFTSTRSRIEQDGLLLRAQVTEDTITATAATSDGLYDTATELLNLLLEKRSQEIQSPLEAFLQKSPQVKSSEIEALIEKLTFATLGETTTQQQQSQSLLQKLVNPKPSYFYDPSESLFGDFYCTLYFYYPNSNDGNKPEDPIWEKTSLKVSNIKGQQYYVRNDFQQSVINYSEVWGPAVTISAEGVLTPVDKDNKNANSRSLRQLPDVFRVDATKITASVFGWNLDFNIQGSANLVVLYADPRVRVFVSPLASETVVGNWEQAGLVVVQVRGDLVPSENKSMPQVIDLR